MPAKKNAASAAKKIPAKKTSTRSQAQPAAAADFDGVVIKKYPNRRLYDTSSSTYITLVDIKTMVVAHQKFVVLDAKNGEDLTRSILLQIILEEESGGL